MKAWSVPVGLTVSLKERTFYERAVSEKFISGALVSIESGRTTRQAVQNRKGHGFLLPFEVRFTFFVGPSSSDLLVHVHKVFCFYYGGVFCTTRPLAGSERMSPKQAKRLWKAQSSAIARLKPMPTNQTTT